MKTLPDLLAPDLKILSVGINPSVRAVLEGFYFPNPRDRFWPALNASALVEEPLTPSPETMRRRLQHYLIGFTDLVKKPSNMASALKAADYREAVPRLETLINELAPATVWFHGKTVLDNYSRYTAKAGAETAGPVAWGLQPGRIGSSRLYVTPNPSPANARFSLAELTAWYAGLNRWI